MATNIMNSMMNTKNDTIVWLDSDDNTTNLFQTVEIFSKFDDFITYLKTWTGERIFMIITDTFYQQYIHGSHFINETSQIFAVYIFSKDLLKEKLWENEGPKIKGAFSDIAFIIDAIQQAISRTRNAHVNNSIISTVDLDYDENDPSFIYLRLLINIILKLDYDDKSKKDGFTHCRIFNADNKVTLNAIDEIEQNYTSQSPIWWYTKESNFNKLLKDSVTNSDFNTLIKMGFFIQDLHREIEKIYSATTQMSKMTVYRGEMMSIDKFEKLNQRKGRLLKFNWFVSTTTKPEVAVHFSHVGISDVTRVAVIFEIELDPWTSSKPFAHLQDQSYYSENEDEILFTMNSIFRIDEISTIKENLWKVKLTLSDAMDEQSQFLTYHIYNEIRGETPWHTLAAFLQKVGRYDMAREIYQKISETTDKNPNEIASMFNNIGLMNDLMEKYSVALSQYEEALTLQMNCVPSDHSSLASIYNNIGMVYRSNGDYKTALSNCEKSLEIRLKSCPTNDKSLINIYSNIGLVYECAGDYSKALSYYKRVHEIQKSSLPSQHPSFTVSYNNLGGIYCLLGNYPQALSYYTQTLEIQEVSLRSDHPSLVITYSNIGYVYQLMGKYMISLSYYQEAEKISSSSSLTVATMYNNIGLVHQSMGNNSQALSYLKKSISKEEEECYQSNHPSLAYSYNNIGTIYQSMKEYENALEYFEKALKIWLETLSSNHPTLATVYNNIGSLYDSKEDYQRALEYYKKAVEILRTTSLNNPLNLASTYNNIGEAYRSMGDFSQALSYYMKTLEIEEKHLSSNHPSLAITLTNMAVALEATNQYQTAYVHAERAVDICCTALGPSHSQTVVYQQYRDQLRSKLMSMKSNTI